MTTDSTRTLGSAGRQIAPIGLGCMGMSWGYDESRRDDHRSVKVIREAVENGVGMIDTALVYGDGHNERLVGEALAASDDHGQLRDRVVLATKGGLVVDDLATKTMHRDGRPASLAAQVDASLDRLGVDHVDLYYLHRIDPQVPVEESWGALADLVTAGKIRWLGLSEVTINQAEAAHRIHPVTAIQSELSLWTRDALGEIGTDISGDTSPAGAGTGTVASGDLVVWARDHGASFVPFAPLGRGYLTGTLAPGEFEVTDFRAANSRFTAEAFRRNRAITDAVAVIAQEHGATPAQVSLAWLLGLSENIIPIPGTRSGVHLRENLAASDLVLSGEERRTLDELPTAFGTRY